MSPNLPVRTFSRFRKKIPDDLYPNTFKLERMRFKLIPMMFALFYLGAKADVVPKVDAIYIAFLVTLAIAGYTTYLVFPNIKSLRLGTVSLIALGLVRSYGYIQIDAYSPLAVWIIVATLAMVAHRALREGVRLD